MPASAAAVVTGAGLVSYARSKCLREVRTGHDGSPVVEMRPKLVTRPPHAVQKTASRIERRAEILRPREKVHPSLASSGLPFATSTSGCGYSALRGCMGRGRQPGQRPQDFVLDIYSLRRMTVDVNSREFCDVDEFIRAEKNCGRPDGRRMELETLSAVAEMALHWSRFYGRSDDEVQSQAMRAEQVS